MRYQSFLMLVFSLFCSQLLFSQINSFPKYLQIDKNIESIKEHCVAKKELKYKEKQYVVYTLEPSQLTRIFGKKVSIAPRIISDTSGRTVAIFLSIENNNPNFYDTLYQYFPKETGATRAINSLKLDNAEEKIISSVTKFKDYFISLGPESIEQNFSISEAYPTQNIFIFIATHSFSAFRLSRDL